MRSSCTGFTLPLGGASPRAYSELKREISQRGTSRDSALRMNWQQLSQRKIDNPVLKLCRIVAKPGNPQFIDGVACSQGLRNQDDSGRVPGFNEAIEMSRHRFEIMRHKHASQGCRQRQHSRVGSGIRYLSLWWRKSTCGSDRWSPRTIAIRRPASASSRALTLTSECGFRETCEPFPQVPGGLASALLPRHGRPPSDKLRFPGDGSLQTR
jgi:hypothetical protein